MRSEWMTVGELIRQLQAMQDDLGPNCPVVVSVGAKVKDDQMRNIRSALTYYRAEIIIELVSERHES